MLSPHRRWAVFIPNMDGGGAQRATLNLVRGIAERGYHVDLVLARAEGPFLNEVPQSVQIVDLAARRVLWSLPALVRYLRGERPEVMLTVMHYANIVGLWARRLTGVPMRVVVNEQNTFSVETGHSAGLKARLMPHLIKLSYPWADDIVAVSRGAATDLAQVTGMPHERIRVIYNPVVIPELSEKAQAFLDHPWFRPGEPPVILAVGRLTAQKDFFTLVRAFARLREDHLARLLILGEGEERPLLEMLVRELGLEQDVSLPGFTDNPYVYMARASVFTLSSRWEGLPTVLIEAMYCRASIVAADCPSGPREILQDGQYGQLVPIGDAAALARAIETALAGNGPRTTVESWRPFTLETVVDQYISMLSGI
jgi:glycosyltransferase involved in cell wall biosynthesis